MRKFAVRAEHGVVGFAPVRALINTGVTAVWPRDARVGLRLVAPDDPACATREEAGSRAGPVSGRDLSRLPHGERVLRSLYEVGRAWLDQIGPCRVDIIDADLLDDGSRLFFATLAELSDGAVTINCPADPSVPASGPADLSGPSGLVSAALSARERRIERLAASSDRLSGEETDFLYEQAVGYLRAGDGWTAEGVLRAVLRQRPTPAVWAKLRTACALLGRPLDAGRERHGDRDGSRDGGRVQQARHGSRSGRADRAGRGPLRLHAGWERLEEWADTAGQIEKNAVHKALFAIADRTVFRSYETYGDAARPLDFFVLVKESLVLKIRFRDLDTFEIAQVGSIDEVPGIDRGTGRAA
ncbi:DUF6235 family protein [Streptomyces sp. NPDC002073]